MYSEADRNRAIELYFKYGRKVASVVRELGYPTGRNLRRWVREWEDNAGNLNRLPRKRRYTQDKNRAAVEHYLTHGGCLAFTRRALGYPSSALLVRWIDKLYPGRRRIFTSIQIPCTPFSPQVKPQAVKDLCIRDTPAVQVAQNVGVSRPLLYKWKDEIIGDEA